MSYKTALTLLAAPLLAISTLYASTNSYFTALEYPDVEQGKIFAPTFNSDHKLLFFTGTKKGDPVTGYFRSQQFLGWTEHKFEPLEVYDHHRSKSITAVSSAPQGNTVVLSSVEGKGPLVSNSNDGKNWYTQELHKHYGFLEKLVRVKSSTLDFTAGYGSTEALFITTSDGHSWQKWTFPNSCQSEYHCSFQNKYFGEAHDKYVLLQHRNLDHIKSNKLYYTTNLIEWYTKQLPFAEDDIQQVFKSKYDVLLATTKSYKDQAHKLWLSPDLSNWASFNLPKSAEVTDAKVYRDNKIALLLVYTKSDSDDGAHEHDGDDKTHENHLALCKNDNGECPPCPCDDGQKDPTTKFTSTTDLVALDPETNSFETLHTFNGRVTDINYFDDKLYLSGNFVNDSDDKHAALISYHM